MDSILSIFDETEQPLPQDGVADRKREVREIEGPDELGAGSRGCKRSKQQPAQGVGSSGEVGVPCTSTTWARRLEACLREFREARGRQTRPLRLSTGCSGLGTPHRGLEVADTMPPQESPARVFFQDLQDTTLKHPGIFLEMPKASREKL